MGLEDAGTMAILLKELCLDNAGKFSLINYRKAVSIYEKIRIPRTGTILDCSKQFGEMEELRDNIHARDELELMIQGELLLNGTLPVMFQGATHNYKESVKREIKVLQEESEMAALENLMPGAFDFAAEKKGMAREVEEERRLAFEQLFYGQ